VALYHIQGILVFDRKIILIAQAGIC